MALNLKLQLCIGTKTEKQLQQQLLSQVKTVMKTHKFMNAPKIMPTTASQPTPMALLERVEILAFDLLEIMNVYSNLVSLQEN